MNKKRLLFILILILGFVLRVYKITAIPSGFFTDEADIGLTAYKILHTGRDQQGGLFPLVVVPGVNGGRNPLDIYLTIPAVYLFGLNEFSVRFTQVVIGLLTLMFFYLASKEILKGKFALISVFLLSISPWLIHFNRIGWEQSSWVLLSVIPVYFILRNNIFLFFLFSGLALYTYHPAWLITVLFILITSVIWMNSKRRYFALFYYSLIFILIAIPLLITIINGNALGRFRDVFGSNTKLNTKKIIENYFAHFEYQFLYEKGDIEYPGNFITRHSIKGMGQLYYFQFPLLMMGLYFLIKRRNWRDKVILTLFILYPLSDSITGTVSATRSIIGVIPLTIISAAGFELAWSKVVTRNNLLIWSTNITFGLVLFFTYYLYGYFITYPFYGSDYWGWQYGPKDIIKYYLSVEKNYDELYLDIKGNAPSIFLPFYTIDYSLGCGKCNIGGLSNYKANKRQLFAVVPDDNLINKYNKKLLLKKNIYYPNGKIAYQIYDTLPKNK